MRATIIIKAYLLFFWYKIIKKKMLQDRIVPHNCKVWYVNVITGQCGIVVPGIIKKRNWYGKVVKEGMGIVRKTGCYYYKSLNEKNGERKALKILNRFYNNVQ